MTVSVVDGALVVVLYLAAVTGWLVVIGGLELAQWPVYALIAAGAVQLFFHSGPTPDLAFPFAVGGFGLIAASLLVLWVTLQQAVALTGTGRFMRIHWQNVATLGLWTLGATSLLIVIHPAFGFVVLVAAGAWVYFVLRAEGRKLRTHVIIEVHCDPADAFALVGDPRRAPTYEDDVEVESTAGEPGRIGYRFASRMRLNGGFVFELEEEIVALQAGQFIKMRSLRHDGFSSWRVERSPIGSRLIYDFETVLSVPQCLLGMKRGVVRRITHRRQEICERLKELLETPPDKGTSFQPTG